MEMERLQKVLAGAGLGSRRFCDDLVSSGRVRVNGQVAEPGTRVSPLSDLIEVDGVRIGLPGERTVIALHKPRGVVTTMADDRGRPCVGDLFRDYPSRLFHVGRLDEDTEGLLLLTNDGALAHRLTHPSHGVPKTYLATVAGVVGPDTLDRLLRGVHLEDGSARADRVGIRGREGGDTVLELVIHEGRKRIVRRMCKAVGHPIVRLVRTRIGGLEMLDLGPGSWRALEPHEVVELEASVL